jgi:hypothetical protein
MKYANAYLARVGVGLVLLARFVLTGHGLGGTPEMLSATIDRALRGLTAPRRALPN